jgi:hypothetical protein
MGRKEACPFAQPLPVLNPDNEVPGNVVAPLKGRGIDVRQYRPALIAAEQLADPDMIVSFACEAGRRLASSKAEERWDECPAVCDDSMSPGPSLRVENLIAHLAAGHRLAR